MMARRTRHPAIRATATIANPDGLAVVSCKAMNQLKQNLVNTGNAIVRVTTASSCRRNSSRISSAVKLSASARAGPRASHLAPKKFDNQKLRVTSSFLFVRHSTQSHDELLAAVPIRPRPCMMLEMINTSDILSIGEDVHACNSSVAGDPSASAADNSSPPSRFSAGGC